METGEPLPSVPADNELPVWYVRVQEPGEDPYATSLEAVRLHEDARQDEAGAQAQVMARS